MVFILNFYFTTTLLPLLIIIPAFGICSFTIVFSLSISSASLSKLNSSPHSFNIFSASDILLPSISGVWTSSIFSTSSWFPWFTSKYGSTSEKICPPTGAATPPPWCPPSPVGLYNVTKTTTWGLSIGATPAKRCYIFICIYSIFRSSCFPSYSIPCNFCIFTSTFRHNRFHHT